MFSLKTLQTKKHWSNWAETAQGQFEEFFTPRSVEELQAIVGKAFKDGKRIRIIGASHSFSPIALPEEICISLHEMRGMDSVDKERGEATFWGGTYLYEIGPLLKEHGLALENMGDIQEQTIAGAVSTGTHGTGITLGSISSQVIEWEWIDGMGEYHIHRRVDQDDSLANCLHVSLGLFGILVRVTLKLLPLYSLKVKTFRATIEEGMSSWKEDLHQFRHLEWFWFPGTKLIQVKQMDAIPPVPQKKWEKTISTISKNVVDNQAFYLLSEICKRNPRRTQWVSEFSAKNIPNRIETGYSYELFATPRKVKFYESEIAIPIERFLECMEELLAGLKDNPFFVHFPIECRFVKDEPGFLNPNFQQDSAFLAFHMYKGMPYEAYFEWIWGVMEKYNGRPHWGKMNNLSKEKIQKLYPKWNNFQEKRQEYDPKGIFLNKYFRELIH
ncbi:D-arabinono-1,4-lactone oxidase [Heyndrickxia sp. NPDC080065]|uniref:D-arabinono-1,4-lactone oxidase n=1 Tax=Heyndrickxia sp. NPDC080065 TaxID=3390568 RepID=UPI003D05DCEC